MIDSHETHYARWKAIELDEKKKFIYSSQKRTKQAFYEEKKSFSAMIILETRTSLIKSFMNGVLGVGDEIEVF